MSYSFYIISDPLKVLFASAKNFQISSWTFVDCQRDDVSIWGLGVTSEIPSMIFEFQNLFTLDFYQTNRVFILNLFLTYFTSCSSVSIVNFEHVNADWANRKIHEMIQFSFHFGIYWLIQLTCKNDSFGHETWQLVLIASLHPIKRLKNHKLIINGFWLIAVDW